MVVLTGTIFNPSFFSSLFVHLIKFLFIQLVLMNILDQRIWVKQANLVFNVFLSKNPKGSIKISKNSLQITYQWDESPVGADMECILDDNMPRYITQVSFNIYMG